MSIIPLFDWIETNLAWTLALIAAIALIIYTFVLLGESTGGRVSKRVKCLRTPIIIAEICILIMLVYIALIVTTEIFS